jgi:hypothetical protein
MLLQTAYLPWLFDELEWQLIALQKICGRVGSLGGDGSSETLQGVLADYSCVVKPFSVWLHPGNWRLAVLIDGRLSHFSCRVTLGLA